MLSCRLNRYYCRLQRPPGTPPTSRNTGYKARRSDDIIRRSPGRGGPLQFPPPPLIRSAPHTPGSPSRLHFQDLHRFRGLRPDGGGSALPDPHPKAGYIDDAAGFASCYGPHHRSPSYRACDAGLQRRTFPSDAASLLPGLLAATRTGLTPAGDDELPITSWLLDNHPLIAGRSKEPG